MEFELYRGEMEAFSSQRDSLESECADLKEQVQRAEESLASAKMEIASAQSNAQEQVDAIRAQLQAAETRASAAKSQLVSLEQDAKDARADMREHQLRADELAERLESAGSRSHDDDEVQAICAERDQARTELDALNARVSTLETEVFGAQQEAEHAQEARDALKREVEELKSSMDVASQSKDSNERCERGSAANLDPSADISSILWLHSTLAERIELLETQLEHKKEELAAKEKDLDSVHDIAQQLGLQLAQSEEKIAVLEHAVKEQDIEVSADAPDCHSFSAKAKRISFRMAVQMDVLRTNDAQNPETETKLEQLREEASQREAVLANALQSLHKRESELSAGKRQLQKLSASLQSAAAGPSRSSSEKMGLAHLQAAHLLESPSLFASPGGRPLVRDFEEDIFDEIEHVRDSWEVVERRLDFIRVEDGMKLAAAESEAKQLAERIQELEGQLIERSEAVESARRESEDALVARDGQIRTLEEELRGLQNEIESLAAKLAAMPEASVEEANSASETGNKAEWEELSLRLTAAEDRAAHMSNLWETLEGKRARLQDIETKRAAVSHVESRTDLHGEALERLERQRAEYADDAEKWMQEAHEVAAHLITSQARVGVLEQQLLETSTALDAARSGAQDGVQAGEPNTQFETKARELQEALAATQAELAQSKVCELLMLGFIFTLLTYVSACPFQEAETAAQEALQLVSKEKATLAEQLADLETELQEMDSSHSAGESIREELAERARRFEEDLGIVTAREQEQASELDVARERIVAMEEASKQLEAGLAAAEQAHQNASGELEEARAQLAAKRLEVENAAYELAAATSADKLHQEEIKHLAAQLEHLQRDMSIDDAISAAADLKRQNAELEARVLRRTEQIGQQQRDLECERTNRTLAEETCEELNEEKAELEERIDTLEAQVREKNDAMLAAEEKVKALEEELSKVKELATVAEQDLLARQEELGTTKQLKAEAEATLEQAKQEAQSHHETVLQLERQLADSESRVGELVAASEAAGNESSERISALQAELREFVDARAELDSELHAARAHALSLDGTSQQRTEEVQQLQESITNLQEALNTMMADADARLVEEEMLRASLQQSDDQLASVRDELKVAREAADERASEVEHLHQSLAAAQTDLEDARSALVGAQESGEEDATRLAAAAQKEAELRGEIDYLQASLEDSLQSLEARKADVSRFEEAVSTMRAELEAARAALETVDGSTAEQKTELERLKFAESGAEAALQERVQALAATTEALTSTHKELQIKNQSLTQLTTELEAARSESSTRQEKIKELENELLAAEAQRREAGEVHAAALTAAEALHSERDALQAEVQQLQGEVSRYTAVP